MATLVDMLVYLRKEAGLSQQELADKIGITRSAIGMYETGRREPDLETLEAFADFYNVDMDTLLGRNTANLVAFNSLDMAGIFNAYDSAIKLAYEDPRVPSDLKDSMVKDLPTRDEFWDDLAYLSAAAMPPKNTSVPQIEKKLLIAFDQLNKDGQQKAVERIEELTEIPKYRAEEQTSNE